jgi:hypothetical protein
LRYDRLPNIAMTRHALTRIALTLFSIFTTNHIGAQTLRATFSPLANFAYQLDCVAGVSRSCAGADDYRLLWKQTFGIDAATSPDVQQWAQLRKEFSRQVQSSGEDPSPIPGSRLDLNKRVLIAAFAANDEPDYRSRLALLLPDTLSTQSDKVIRALYPPFLDWWQSAGQAQGKPTADGLINAIDTPTIQKHVTEIVKIFGAPSAAQAVATVHLMYRPGLVESKNTSGESLGRESVAEFFASGDPSRAMPVMLHEYAHFVFASSDVSRATALRDGILKGSGDTGLPVWTLFNEAIATALGNGRVHRSLATKEAFAAYAARPASFYASPDVDAAAKAILPLVDATVAANGTVFDDAFIRGYVQAVQARLGDALATPAAFMQNYTLIVDSALGTGPQGGAPWVKQFSSSGRWMYVMDCCDGKFADAVKANVGKKVTVMAVTTAQLPPLLPMLNLSSTSREALGTALSNPDASAAVLVSRDGVTPPSIVVVAQDAAAFGRAAEWVAAMPVLKSAVSSVR